MEIVKKLSIGKIVGKVVPLLPEKRTDTTPVTLGKTVGIARGLEHGESTYGPWTALKGDFVFEASEGPNKGKRYRSGKLFVPDVVLDLVSAEVENLDKGEAVQMAFAITAKNDPESSVGYTYGCSFLIEPAANDPLANLMDRALPAPNEDDDESESEEKGKGKGK